MTDELIDWQRLRIGDRDAWDVLYSTTCRRTYRVLFYLTAASRSVLEELNQDVWLSAIESIDRFDASRGTAIDWILGITRKKGLAFRRKHYANREVCVGGERELLESGTIADDQLVVNERAALIRAALESLPETWQYVLRQKYQCGSSVREIADLMDLSPKAVESTLSRARKRLRQLIHEFIKEQP